MIDFHSHILPEIDDGATSVEESIKMLLESYAQGVRTIVLTSHCYITEESDIDVFLERRSESYEKLRAAIAQTDSPMPRILLGAEVHMAKNIHHYERLGELCIENTNYILLEMPYSTWDDALYETIYGITLKGYRPIMAHIERYLDKEKLFENLYSLNLLYQVNAESFMFKRLRHKMLKMFMRDGLHVIGSDTHNMDSRKTFMGKAKEIITKKFGEEYFDFLIANSEDILENRVVAIRQLPKLGLKAKIML